MKINTSRISLIVIIGVLATTVIARPNWLSDNNEFLLGFVNHNYLNVLGVILAITLASLSQAHLSLNRIEEQRGRENFHETRTEIKEAAYWLIGLFIAGLVLVILKPIICASETTTAAANAFAILILAMYVLILVDITMAVFDIKAEINDDQSR